MGGSLFSTFSLFIIMIKFIFVSGFSHSCRPVLSYGFAVHWFFESYDSSEFLIIKYF